MTGRVSGWEMGNSPRQPIKDGGGGDWSVHPHKGFNLKRELMAHEELVLFRPCSTDHLVTGRR